VDLGALDATAVRVYAEHHVTARDHPIGLLVPLAGAPDDRGSLASVLIVEQDLHPSEVDLGGIRERVRGVCPDPTLAHAVHRDEARHAEDHGRVDAPHELARHGRILVRLTGPEAEEGSLARDEPPLRLLAHVKSLRIS
jgi:hypothetical protein